MRLAGMPEPLPPDFPEGDFFSLDVFTGARLEWLIHQHVCDYIDETPAEICPLPGGYVLSDNEGSLLHPQCCGDLSDVMWWKHVCYDSKCVYYNGHPCPDLIFGGNTIGFSCFDEYDPFDAETKTNFEIEHGALIAAYEAMLPNLLRFKQRVAEAVHQLGLPTAAGWDLSSVLTVNNKELNEQDPWG